MVSLMYRIVEHASILRTRIIMGVNKNEHELMITKYKTLIDLHIAPKSISEQDS